MDKTKEQI